MSKPQNVQTAKCPTAICPDRKMSNRNTSRPQNVPTAKCTQPQIVHFSAKCLTARCQDRNSSRPRIGNRNLRSSPTPLYDESTGRTGELVRVVRGGPGFETVSGWLRTLRVADSCGGRGPGFETAAGWLRTMRVADSCGGQIFMDL